MSYQQILDSEIQSGSPVDGGLLLKIKNNDDTFNTADNDTAAQITSILSVVNLTDDSLVGSTIYTVKNVAPRGYISAMGSIIGKTAGTFVGSNYYKLYETLWDIALNTAGQPYYLSAAKGTDALTDWNAGKTIKIDESGLFTCTYKSGVTNDVGLKQDDAFQGHEHSFQYGPASPTRVYAGASNDTGNQSTDYTDTISTKSGYGTPRYANETRPINVAKYAYIRYAVSQPTLLALPNGIETNYTIEAAGNAGQIISGTDIPFIATRQDGFSWDGTGFIAPFNCEVSFEGGVKNTTAPGNGTILAYINGANPKVVGITSNTAGNMTFSGTAKLISGQRLSFRQSISGQTMSNDTAGHWLKITKLNG